MRSRSGGSVAGVSPWSTAPATPTIEPRGSRLVTFAVAAVGAALTLGAFALMRTRETELRRADFERRSRDLATTLQAGLAGPVEVLRSLPAFFEASDQEVSRAQFGEFVRPALARHPSIAALEWFPLVRRDERAGFEEATRREIPGFEIRDPAGGLMVRSPVRETHLALSFMEPPTPSVIGLDLGFEADGRARADRAGASGLLLVSPRTKLVEDTEGVHSVVLYAPVYRRGAPRATDAQRQAAWKGVAVALLRLKPLVESALHGAALEGLSLELVDESGPPELRSLYTRPLPEPGALRFAHPLGLGDRRYGLRVAGDRKADGPGAASVAVLLFGALLTALTTTAFALRAWLARVRSRALAAEQLGSYVLEERIGEGGMGIVYRARHALMRRPTAVKLLSQASPRHVVRFEREVRATSQLTHPNTVAIYDYGRTPDGVFYYAMEYLEGLTLEALVAECGPLEPERVVHVLGQVCGAVGEAHAAGLVHRDLKPANLMLTTRGGIHDFVKVLDFGLVKDLDGRDATLSVEGAIMGTPLYMAPEALTDGSRVGPASDLYALGAIAYFLLTGRTIFPADNMVQIIAYAMTLEVDAPSRLAPAVPPALDALVLRCLAKKPADRPASAQAMLDELAVIAASLPAWTEARARAWWETQGRAVVARVRAARSAAEGDASSRTLAVDLRKRPAVEDEPFP